MKRALFLFIIFFAGFSIFNSSCINDDISTSATDILSFSCDTVAFDTIFTEVGTPTARLIVANRASKGIRISSIRLKNPNSAFQFNVDGMSGREFSDIEIMAHDSIFVFIECQPPLSATDTPNLIEDELQFLTNGVPQSVRLEAYGQNVTRLRGVTITSDTILDASRPVVVFDSLVVAPDATLKLAPGTNLLFHDKASMTIRGRLEAVGTQKAPINMRGDRLDNVLPNVSYDILASQWQGIRIAPESFDNRMEHVNMRSTQWGLRIDSCADTSKTKLTLRHSWLHNSAGDVISSQYGSIDAQFTCFSEAANAVLRLKGGSHRFEYCTFANFYLFAAVSSPIINLDHLIQPTDQPTTNPMPLMSAEFIRCITYGIGGDITPGNLDDSNVFFRNSAFGVIGEDDDHFIESLWNCDPLFMTRRSDYYFDYRLEHTSETTGYGAYPDPIPPRKLQ